MTRHVVRHGFGKNVRKGPARGPEHGLWLHAKGQSLERRAFEFDHEFAHALWPRLARLAAIAQACCNASRELGWKRLIRGPIEAIRKAELGSGRRRFFRSPHRDNIVVDFIVGWDFDQLDRAFAPIPFGLDPEARTAVIKDPILIMVKGPVALQQPEAARVFIQKGRCDDAWRIVERTPRSLSRPHP